MACGNTSRRGTIADLSDTLLDKVLEVPSCKSYTQYVKAFMDATNGDMTDYQGIVKLLIEFLRLALFQKFDVCNWTKFRLKLLR